MRHSLLGVCRRWRSLVFSTPSFWTTLLVDPMVRSNFQEHQKCLQYAGDGALDVIMRPRFCLSRCLDSIALIRTQLHRIKRINIGILFRDEIEALFPVGSEAETVTHFPALEFLRIPNFNARQAALDPESYMPMSLVMGRIFAPKLEYLWVRSATALPSLITTSFLPLRYLRVDHGKEVIVSDTLTQFLSICPLLEVLCVVNQSLVDRAIPWPLSARLPLKKLHTFSLLTVRGSDILYFLRTLHLPALKFLRYNHVKTKDIHLDPAFILQLFWWFMTEGSRTLEDVLLDSHSIPPQIGVVEPLLINLTNLRNLELHQIEAGSSILEALTPIPGTAVESWPCPNLRSLILRTVDITSREALLDFVEARCYIDPAITPPSPKDCRLREDRVWYLHRMHDYVAEWILQNAGSLAPSENDWSAGRRCAVGVFHCVYLTDSIFQTVLELKDRFWGVRYVP